jgi:hypothetical protein
MIVFSARSGLAKEMADEWFEKYLKAGEITPELEIEREHISQVIISSMCRPKQR